jgi:hypothetical protein
MTGKDAHRAVNLARFYCGLGYTAAPPAPVTVPDEDTVTLAVSVGAPAPVLPLLVHVDATWARGPGPKASINYLMVWGCAGGSPGGQAGPGRGYFWLGHKVLWPSMTVRLDSLLGNRGVVLPGRLVSLRLAVAQPGLSPFFACRAAFRNAAE